MSNENQITLSSFAAFVRTQVAQISTMDPLDSRIADILSGVWDEAKKMESAKSEITEAQVVAFLASRMADLRAKFGPKGYVNMRVNAAQYAPSRPPEFYFQIGADVLAKDYTGATFAEALANADEETPEKKAAEKRAQAARLIAEADAIAPSAEMLAKAQSIEAAAKTQ